MLFKIIILSNFLFTGLKLYSQEYIYPVAYDKKHKKVYLVYQNKLDDIKLWSWDPKTEIAFPAMLSYYIPAGLKLLPDYSGFSFIDKGLVRIKYFNKRAPKTIELYYPIHDISSLNWIDKNSFYLSAEKNSKNAVIHVDLKEKSIYSVCESESCDYLFPQKIDNNLYSIKRENNTYSIVKTSYKKDKLKKETLVLNLYNAQAKFLRLINNNLGYFLEQVKPLNKEQISFNCWRFFKQKKYNKYQIKKIFNFNLPKKYFANKEYLFYESILPFLPVYKAKEVFFYNKENNNINIYSYNLKENKTKKLTGLDKTKNNNYKICFSALELDDKMIYGSIGGVKTYNKSKQKTKEISKKIEVAFDAECGLPKVKLPVI